jgi:hypothetical protein
MKVAGPGEEGMRHVGEEEGPPEKKLRNSTDFGLHNLLKDV